MNKKKYEFKKTQSDSLRDTATKFGGGRGTYNKKARKQEHYLKETINKRLIPQLSKEFPNVGFDLKNQLHKREIAKNLGKPNWKPESKEPYIKPDGGVLYARIDGCMYPILASEAKQQGTNDKRKEEGKKKQSMGNAIERASKNYSELKCYFTPYDYFPYHLFISGCDFKKGSSIIDRIDVLTNYEPRNVDYTFHPERISSVWLREDIWTLDEIYDRIYETASSVIKYITMQNKKKGKNFSANNATGKRKKSDFYETPYSLTRKFLDVEPFDKSLTVCEPACGGGAISTILKERWENNLVSAYDIETDFLLETSNYNYVVTNPPFSLAHEFILKAKSVAKNKFAFLLPLSYLHGKKRFDQIYSDKKYPLKKVYVFTRYPMLGEELREDGKYTTGMMVYAWFVWEKNYSGEPTISWIDNNDDVLSKKDIVISKNNIIQEVETPLTKILQ